MNLWDHSLNLNAKKEILQPWIKIACAQTEKERRRYCTYRIFPSTGFAKDYWVIIFRSSLAYRIMEDSCPLAQQFTSASLAWMQSQMLLLHTKKQTKKKSSNSAILVTVYCSDQPNTLVFNAQYKTKGKYM